VTGWRCRVRGGSWNFSAWLAGNGKRMITLAASSSPIVETRKNSQTRVSLLMDLHCICALFQSNLTKVTAGADVVKLLPALRSEIGVDIVHVAQTGHRLGFFLAFCFVLFVQVAQNFPREVCKVGWEAGTWVRG
jgi:hypothetical protein